MNAKTLADKIGMHPNTIYKQIREGKIKATKVGKSYEVDDFAAHKMIVNHIYEKSSNVANFIMDNFLEELKDLKRCAFTTFLLEMHSISEPYIKALDSLEDWELGNIENNQLFTRLEDEAMKAFEEKTIDHWASEEISTMDMLNEYIELSKAIKIIEENKIFAEYRNNKETQFSKYDEIKKKLNKEEITIKEVNEYIEI